MLARRYRPKDLSQMIGQDLLIQTLTRALSENRLPNAFIFHGIRGTGKTTVARILARSLNCAKEATPTISPCGSCISCKNLDQDAHLDVMEMDAASHTSVDHIRELIESSRYRPVHGRYKVFIIDEVHMLSKSAFNALLKTLEEPPAHVKFLFATTEIRKIPDTILSRCMRFDLKPIDPKILINHLNFILTQEKRTADIRALGMIVRSSGGSARDALSLLDQALTLSTEDVTYEIVKSMLGLMDRAPLFELVQSLLDHNIENIFALTKQFGCEGIDPILLTESLLDLIYWLATLKVVPILMHDVTWPEEDRKTGKNLVENLQVTTLLRLWQALLKGYDDVLKSPEPFQALNMVLMRLCFVKELPPIEDVLKRLNHGGEALPATPQPFRKNI